MRHPVNPALVAKHQEENKRKKSMRLWEVWSQSPEGRRAIAVSEEFSAKWKRELAEIEGKT